MRTMGERSKKILSKRGFKSINFKWVRSNEPNAADYSMIRSCLDVLRTKPHITQIVLITGDGDFSVLTKKLTNYSRVVICQKHNFSKKLIASVNEAHSVTTLAHNQRKWFK